MAELAGARGGLPADEKGAAGLVLGRTMKAGEALPADNGGTRIVAPVDPRVAVVAQDRQLGGMQPVRVRDEQRVGLAVGPRRLDRGSVLQEALQRRMAHDGSHGDEDARWRENENARCSGATTAAILP